MHTKVRKNTAVTLKEKIEMLKFVDIGNISKSAICKKFGIANATLSAIIKNREKIKRIFELSKYNPNRKQIRTTKYEDLDCALVTWCNQTSSQNIPISAHTFMEKVDELTMQMGYEFSPNDDWMDRFKKRNGIGFKNECGESVSYDNISTEEILSDDIVDGPVAMDLVDVNLLVDQLDDSSEDDPLDIEMTAVPTTTEVRTMLKSVRRYLDVNSNGEMSRTIDDLEQFILKQISDTAQKKITDFFKRI